MSPATLHPRPIHQQTIKVEEVSADVGVGSFARDSLVKAENAIRSDGAPGPAPKLPRKPFKGQSGHDNNRRRAPQRNASSRARIGVSKAYAPLLVPASVEELSGISPEQVLDENSDTEMLLNIDDLIGDLDSSDDSDGYTEAGAAQASSRRSRRGVLGKRKGGTLAQQGGEENAVGGKRSRRGERLDREDWMLIRGEGVAKRKNAVGRRRICLLSEEEKGGLDREKIEKLVDFMAETIDWEGALRAIRGGHTASVSGGPSIKDSEDLSLPTEALSGHWRDVLSKRLAEMYPL